ncbi:hypothetical protein Despr_0658 [Desulfobulbus propionicus DSM 2032]|uniref:Type II secretion system protein GspI n=1 Tax=Desulfobulbus propionicus (strain ATCC 33891 / DSM 2032 / VKM B-1956 / 1pr3) TaxID=577650 RepID=A0A7U3YK26_DESPD|nr:prepilin-type N-terminal cleavage/methylation domain-containing protein [Desulfobulbus propionicus]ADW16834.1 hypothetical protein Despr_0658 [Desulfobulbus propionicus DSM 2032]
MWFRRPTPFPADRLPEGGKGRSGGFTLLEVMIAVAVIAIALVTLIGAQSQSVSLATGAKFDTLASLLAQWKMTDLMQQEYDQLAAGQGTFGEDYPQFFWKVTVSDLSESDTGIKGAGDLLKMLELTVGVEQDSRLVYTVRSMVMKQPEAGVQGDAGKKPEGERKAEGPPGAQKPPALETAQ